MYNNIESNSYEQYLENWIPPLHPKSKTELEPLTKEQFLNKRSNVMNDEQELMETHFGHLTPLELQDAIELVALITD